MKKYFIATIAAAAVLSLSLSAAAKADIATTAPTQSLTTASAASHQGVTLKNALEKVNLTEDQKAKIKQILSDARTQTNLIKSDVSLAPANQKVKLQAVHENTRKSIALVLTPAQKAQVEQIMDKSLVSQTKEEDFSYLNLTDAQKTQIGQIMQSSRSSIDAINANAFLSESDKKSQVRETRRNAIKQIAALLTPEQKALWKQHRSSSRKTNQ
jgi:Spy/CpxP family protein refolding chaperone